MGRALLKDRLRNIFRIRRGTPSRSSGGRHAFTLTEMLVVITIIGILVGLIMPAIVGARANAQRLDCASRLKELALAVVKYESTKQQYPGYIQALPKTVSVYTSGSDFYRQTPMHLLVPWTVMLLPELNRMDLWNEYRVPNAYPTAVSTGLPPMVLRSFVCPSDTRTDLRPLSYVANCGLRDSTNENYPPDWTANGVFQNLYFYRAVAGSSTYYGIRSSRLLPCRSGDIKDGTSYTILLSENLQAWQWCLGAATEIVPNLYPETLWGMVWWGPQDFTATVATSPRMINVERTPTEAATYLNSGSYYYFSRPSSNHSTGVNVAMCDGRVVFLRENIAYPVFAQLMTSDGQQITTPGNTTAYVNKSSYAAWYTPIPKDIVD